MAKKVSYINGWFGVQKKLLSKKINKFGLYFYFIKLILKELQCLFFQHRTLIVDFIYFDDYKYPQCSNLWILISSYI